jgi:hypothetical protein
MRMTTSHQRRACNIRLAIGLISGLALLAPGAASARLAKPALQSPATGASVQQLGAFFWGSVRGAAQYDFEISADPRFSSAVKGFGGVDTRLTHTWISTDKETPDGTYYWRVRGVTAADHPGPWSATRTIVKSWNPVPTLIGPTPGTTVAWPSAPLVMGWTPVPFAVNYNVYIATDPALVNLVTGPVPQTQGTTLAFPTSLAPGTYYWAVAPLDAEGDKGRLSAISTFKWTWPSDVTPTETNISSDPGVDEPSFSWPAIPGASSYEIEISRASDFAPGSDIIDHPGIVGTQYTPSQFLANETTLYWRMRAHDARNDAGDWNSGQPFTESFDAGTPTVQSLRVIDQNGTAQPLGTQTNDLIVSWNPVPGASSYRVLVAGWCSATDAAAGTCFDTQQTFAGCDFNNSHQMTTPNTFWTPIAGGESTTWLSEYSWPSPGGGIQLNPGYPAGTLGPFCLSVAAIRDDGPIAGPQIISAPTVLGNTNTPAFVYQTPAQTSGQLTETSVQQGSYQGPTGAQTTAATPLLLWHPVSGADGYFVAIARDANFTNVVHIGYTNTTSYVPPISLADETSAYYWEIVPVGLTTTGASQDLTGAPPSIPQATNDDVPQSFNKSSVPPGPISPINGATVQTQPTFQWSSATGARNYTLEVAADPTFSAPILNLTTDSTSYTSETTLPADKTLYWRVRATDLNGIGLNWSDCCGNGAATFTHHLPVPSPSPSNPTGGGGIPLLSWSPVNGAIGYDVHVDQSDGSTRDFTVNSPNLTPVIFYGTGIWKWQVRADFPGGVTSAYFTPEVPFVRTIAPPTGVHATKTGARIQITWNTDPAAKLYEVQLSTTDGFASPSNTDQTEVNIWTPQIDAVTAAHTIFWRLAAVDTGGNIGAYASGVFHPPGKGKPKPKKKRKKK